MDLTLTPEEQAFRDEVRAWIADNHPGPAPTGGDEVQFRVRARVAAQAARGGLGRHLLAEGVRRAAARR